MPRQSRRCLRSFSLALILAATAAAGCGGTSGPDANPIAAGPTPDAGSVTTSSIEVTPPAPGSSRPTAAPPTEPSESPTIAVGTTPAPLIARVDLPRGVIPVAMTAGFDSLWVADHNSPGVYRIDPTTNTISAHIQTRRSSCMQGVTVVLDEVWQSTCGVGSFIRIDPSTNQVIQEVSGLNGVMSLDGEIWATDMRTTPGALVRLDAETLIEVERIHVGAAPGYLAADQQSVWVVNHDDRTVSRVDRASRTVVATIPLGEPSLRNGGAITLAGGYVWVDHLNDGSIYRIDPVDNTTERIFLDLKVSGHYKEQYIHGSETGVWVRVRSGQIVQLSPATGQEIAVHPVDLGGGDMEVAFGSLWVSGLDGVQRFNID